MLGNIYELYMSNADIHRYVDRYIAKECISIEEALTHKVVVEYAKYVRDRGDSEHKLPNMWGECRSSSREHGGDLGALYGKEDTYGSLRCKT